MNLKPLLLVPAAATALLLAGCSSNDDTTATDSPQTSDVAAETTCPTAEAPADAKPEWTVDGTTGSVAIVGQTDTTAPRITVTTPFVVDKTEVKTLSEGSGEVVDETSTVAVCYVGVNGRTGETFDSAYERGEPATFPASGVVPGFKQALVGQKAGSSVAVVITSQDGYADGNPGAGIKKGDTLVFALKILSIY